MLPFVKENEKMISATGDGNMSVQGNPCLGNCTRYFTHAHAAYHECEVDEEGNRELCSPQEVDDSVKMKFIAFFFLHFEDYLFFSSHQQLLSRCLTWTKVNISLVYFFSISQPFL